MMKRPVTIYALLDSDGTPRYVGQTRKTLEFRLYQHLHEPRYRWSHAFPRCVWIAALLASGQAPLIHAIEIVDEEDADVCERAYIAAYLAQGYHLVNGTHTPEHRVKTGIANRASWVRWKAREQEWAARAAAVPTPEEEQEQEGAP